MANTQNMRFVSPQQFISIPVKIIDGIFMSDNNIAHDIDWLQTNQVSHIINCAGKHCPNLNKANGISYLTFDWSQANIQNILDQNVISSSIGFIQEARRENGTILLHYFQSQSRPFCLLVAYFMIKYQWNLYKTLEFLNSRRQDIELQPNFFEQLTTLHQKLHDKGLIKSRNWVVTENMSDDEIILTNTFLNSRKKNNNQNNQTKNRPKSKQGRQKACSVNWKQSLIVQHVYSPSATIYVQQKRAGSAPRQQNKQNRQSKQAKERPEFVKKDENNLIQGKIITKNQITQQKIAANGNSGDINVTKKWNQLRQSWMKQKENINNNSIGTYIIYSEIPRKMPTTSAAKCEAQRISDRLQDKLSLLRTQQQKIDSRNKVKQNRQAKQTNQGKQNLKENINAKENQENRNDQNKVTHNNWIINNQVLKDTNNASADKKVLKNTGNKSVIIVKPNHLGISQENKDNHRSSLRKITGSQRKKVDKQQTDSEAKFFKNQAVYRQTTPLGKLRSSSAKPQRKQLQNTAIMKNSSFSSKGKWKF